MNFESAIGIYPRDFDESKKEEAKKENEILE